MSKHDLGIGSRKQEGNAERPVSEAWLLLIFWLVTSGFCLLLCNAIVTALCQMETHLS